jgi:serine/threonine-protein kinase
MFVSKLEKALRDNLFEDVIQKNADLINSVVSGGYSYNNHVDIPLTVVKDFLDWFKLSTPQSQRLILTNIISKLSTIYIEEKETELPF